jgi:hypothetical protein
MNVTNYYTKPISFVKGDKIVQLIYKDNPIKEDPVTYEMSNVIVGIPVFEYNPIYTTQYSTTQGLTALNIFNHYDVPLTVNDRVISPRCQYRYKGVYDNGIPYGEILRSTYDEDVVINNRATNLHYGLLVLT